MSAAVLRRIDDTRHMRRFDVQPDYRRPDGGDGVVGLCDGLDAGGCTLCTGADRGACTAGMGALTCEVGSTL